jgi:flagellar biosynthesis/type III secretory pathway protein FliH
LNKQKKARFDFAFNKERIKALTKGAMEKVEREPKREIKGKLEEKKEVKREEKVTEKKKPKRKEFKEKEEEIKERKEEIEELCKKAREEGHKEGFRKGLERIAVPCASCGKECIYVLREDMKEALTTYVDFYCKECYSKGKKIL